MELFFYFWKLNYKIKGKLKKKTRINILHGAFKKGQNSCFFLFLCKAPMV